MNFGQVTEIRITNTEVWLEVTEASHQRALSVYPTPKALAISPGDLIEWGEVYVFWTPLDREGRVYAFEEMPIPLKNKPQAGFPMELEVEKLFRLPHDAWW